jgi:hypothetical protein
LVGENIRRRRELSWPPRLQSAAGGTNHCNHCNARGMNPIRWAGAPPTSICIIQHEPSSPFHRARNQSDSRERGPPRFQSAERETNHCNLPIASRTNLTPRRGPPRLQFAAPAPNLHHHPIACTTILIPSPAYILTRVRSPSSPRRPPHLHRRYPTPHRTSLTRHIRRNHHPTRRRLRLREPQLRMRYPVRKQLQPRAEHYRMYKE